MANTKACRDAIAERHPNFAKYTEAVVDAFSVQGKEQNKLAVLRDKVAVTAVTTAAVILQVFQDTDAGTLEEQHDFVNDVRESIFPSATYERINGNMGTILGRIRKYAVTDGLVFKETRPREDNRNFRYYEVTEGEAGALDSWTARVKAASNLNQLAPPKVTATRNGRDEASTGGRVKLPDVPVKDWPEAYAKASGAVVLAITNASKVLKLADETRDEVLTDWNQVALHAVKANGATETTATK